MALDVHALGVRQKLYVKSNLMTTPNYADCNQVLKMALDVARGMAYLHRSARTCYSCMRGTSIFSAVLYMNISGD